MTDANLLSHYIVASQDLAYAARRAREMASPNLSRGYPSIGEREKFANFLGMCAENHRRMCERMGVDTHRKPNSFPLTEYEVHHRFLTDPMAAAVIHVLEDLQHQHGTLMLEQMVAAVFFMLDQAKLPPESRDTRALSNRRLTIDQLKRVLDG